MTNAELIIQNLQTLIESWKEMQKEVAEGEEKYIPVQDEYGSDLTWQIACHPIFKGDRPCLNKVRNAEYGECEFGENCKECKAMWLMEDYI